MSKTGLLIICLAWINITTFLVYGYDKHQAIKEGYRISENTLLVLAAAGGSAGALASMYLFRHKTRKAKFTFGIPAILAVQLILLTRLI